jgi:hypothetical protein
MNREKCQDEPRKMSGLVPKTSLCKITATNVSIVAMEYS